MSHEMHPWNYGSHGEKVFARVRRDYEEVERIQQEHLKQDALPESARKIAAKCDQIKAFLIEKNLAYGNSALDPINIFSDADAVKTMENSLDHKLSRIARGHEFRGDDTIIDLTGYLILYLIAKEEA